MANRKGQRKMYTNNQPGNTNPATKSSAARIIIAIVVTLAVLCGGVVCAHFTGWIDLPFFSGSRQKTDESTVQRVVELEPESGAQPKEISSSSFQTEEILSVPFGEYVNFNDQTSDDYFPQLELHTDGTFTFRLNYYEGTMDIPGFVQILDDRIVQCFVDPDYNRGVIDAMHDNQAISVGFFEFEFDGRDLIYISEWSLGMTNKGDVFSQLNAPDDMQDARLNDVTHYPVLPDYPPGEKRGNLIGNTAVKNGAFVAVQEDWVYYVDCIGTPFTGIFKSRHDGSGTVELNKLFEQGFWLQFHLNVYDDWIYFVAMDRRSNQTFYPIIRMRTNGTDMEKIFVGIDYNCQIYHISIVDDWIYFGVLYDGIYKCRLDGSDITKIIDEPYTYFINVVGGWIYYTNQEQIGINKIQTDGTGKTKLVDDEVHGINVIGGWVYFVSKEDNMFHRIRTDGSGRQRYENPLATISLEPGMPISLTMIVSDGYIYYYTSCLYEIADRTIRVIPANFEDIHVSPRILGNANLTASRFTVNFDGSWIYFYEGFGFFHAIHRINTDSLEIQIMME